MNSGKPQVLISVSDDLEAVAESLRPHLEDLKAVGLDFPFKKHEIYVDQPISRYVRLGWVRLGKIRLD
jgi:hypothetical protein